MKIKVCESKYIKHYKDGKGHYISVYRGKDGELYAEGDVPATGYTVTWDNDMAEHCEIDLGFEEIRNLNPANINLAEYEYCSHADGRDAHWQLYRKIVDGKGKWVARHQNTGEIREINYDQARGFEPIDDSPTARLSRSLGSTLLPKRESPFYGGAFDISDTAYFTRDDLDEFSDDVVEKLSDASHADIIADVVECYLDEDTNILELTLSYGEYEHTLETKIDMRKIKIPKDLIKAYSDKFVNYFLNKFMTDIEQASSITESTRKNRESVKCLTNGFGDYINVYRDIDTGRLRAEGDIVHGKFIVGGSFNGPWDDRKEKHYKELGFREVTESFSLKANSEADLQLPSVIFRGLDDCDGIKMYEDIEDSNHKRESSHNASNISLESIYNSVESAYEELTKFNGTVFGSFYTAPSGGYMEPVVYRIAAVSVDKNGCHVSVGHWKIDGQFYNYTWISLSRLLTYIGKDATSSEADFLSKLKQFYKESYAEHIDPEEYTEKAIEHFRSKNPSESEYIKDGVSLYASAFKIEYN